MTPTKQTFELADGKKLSVRRPVADQDLEQMMSFFSRLPSRLRNYLRYDVRNIALCRGRLDLVDDKNHWRLVGEIDGQIVGDGSMDREPFGWTHHIANLRVVVDPQMESLGVNTVIIRCLVELGKGSGVDRFYSEVIKEHKEMIGALEDEGFAYEATRKDYAKDLKGNLHDVVIMSNDQGSVWRKLEEHIDALDIRMADIFRGA